MADGGPTPSTSTALVPLGHVSDDITSDILAGMKRKLDQVIMFCVQNRTAMNEKRDRIDIIM